jgi:hypothetical protein
LRDSEFGLAWAASVFFSSSAGPCCFGARFRVQFIERAFFNIFRILVSGMGLLWSEKAVTGATVEYLDSLSIQSLVEPSLPTHWKNESPKSVPSSPTSLVSIKIAGIAKAVDLGKPLSPCRWLGRSSIVLEALRTSPLLCFPIEFCCSPVPYVPLVLRSFAFITQSLLFVCFDTTDLQEEDR